MKKTLITLLAICILFINNNSLFAQSDYETVIEKILLDTDSVFCFIENHKDSYTGKKNISTGFVSFLHGKYKIKKNIDVIGLYISLDGLKFEIIQDNNFYIKFTDNSIIKFPVLEKQLSGSYINGAYSNSFYFILMNDKKDILKTKKIYGMRFGDYSEYLFNEYDSNQFYEMINCMIQTKK